MPTPPTVKIGVWENKQFIGCVIFSRGACSHLGKPYGLNQTEVCELSRVALKEHATPVSRIISIAVKFLRKTNPGLKLIVSFADANEGHHGGIYQALGWIYTGKSSPMSKFKDKTGRIWHNRQVSKSGIKKQYGEYRVVPKTTECEKIPQQGKFRYLLPLTPELRNAMVKLSRPYPKRADSSAVRTA